MLFNSAAFIFVFLPVTLVGFFVIQKIAATPIARMVWLAAASLAFYGYWNSAFLPIIVVSIAANFLFATAIRTYARFAYGLFITAVTANLLALGFYKYANFALDILNSFASRPLPPLEVALPLGISFFTFTQIAYLADVTFGRTYERSFIKYFLFVTYFPHLIAGPILHHKEMMPQFDVPKVRLRPERLAIGETIFAIGLFKKAVVADYLASIASPVFSAAGKHAVSTLDAWGGALAYSLQIYFDFSGYCDMAIGMSFLFGIVLPFNFDAPYKSRSIVEFWQRWHITLSRFLRDYLYIPLGGNRHGEARRTLNLALTMLIGGLWHGAGYTFVIWGALHGLFLVINHRWRGVRDRSAGLTRAAGTLPYALVSLVLTQLCVVVAWVFFRAESMDAAHRVLGAMFGLDGTTATATAILAYRVDFWVIAAGYLACLILPNVNELFRDEKVGLDTYRLPRRWSIVRPRWRMDVAWTLAAAALFASALFTMLAVGNATPFLYFQF